MACNRPYHTFFSSVLADLGLWIRVLRKKVMAQGMLEWQALSTNPEKLMASPVAETAARGDPQRSAI